MRVLLDECLDPGIRDFLAGHQVTTVFEARWQSTADHQLVQLAQGNFDVLLTLDRGLEFQHNLKSLTFGIVILHPIRNRREDHAPMAEGLQEAVKKVQPGQVLHVYAEELAFYRPRNHGQAEPPVPH